jgi:tRNA A37 N6-isopentenylltransferase MiaA
MERRKLEIELDREVAEENDKVWEMQSSRTLDKLQRMAFKDIQRVTTLLEILHKVDQLLSDNRSKREITRADATLYMKAFALFTLSDENMEKVEAELKGR